MYPNIDTVSGGFEKCEIVCDNIIITSPIDLLDSHLTRALRLGFKNILIEKPGSINLEHMRKIIDEYGDRNIYIGYNRRFYSTVIKAKEIIENDGGVLSFNMNITELIHRINEENYDKNTLERWLYSMTTHLLDLGFYLGGEPEEINCITGGKDKINWHKNASIFSGHGITKSGAIFTYHGNWASAGKWRLEIYTRNHMILFSPLEKLVVQKRGEMKFEEIECEIDNEIKEGIYKQTEEFINGNVNKSLQTYKKQYIIMKNIYKLIGEY